MEKKNFDVKKLTNFISRSSKQLLFFLLEDRTENKKDKNRIEQRLNEASLNKQLVVLHIIKDEGTQEYESLAGFIISKSLDFQLDRLLLKPLDENAPLRIVKIHTIKKVAMLESPKKANNSKTQAK